MKQRSPYLDIGRRIGRALVLAAVAYFAWLIFWGIGQSLQGVAGAIGALFGAQDSVQEPASGWYKVGYYGQWVYAMVSLLVVLAAVANSQKRFVIGGTWFLVTLILAAAGYVAFEGSVGTVALGTGAVGACWFWLTLQARQRAA